MTLILSEEDQERYLDKGLKKIQAQTFHIHTAIEKNNLRQCLKETYQMLSELKTNALTPKNYYHCAYSQKLLSFIYNNIR